MRPPKKIYIDDPTGEFDDHWNIYPNNNSIEYVRKDAFIEKTGELLARMIWEVTYEDLEGDSVQHYDKTEFIEDFKNYLKGE